MPEMTEIRARIAVPDLPCDDDEQWEPLAEAPGLVLFTASHWHP